MRILNSRRPDALGTLITADRPVTDRPLTAVAAKTGVTVVDRVPAHRAGHQHGRDQRDVRRPRGPPAGTGHGHSGARRVSCSTRRTAITVIAISSPFRAASRVAPIALDQFGPVSMPYPIG